MARLASEAQARGRLFSRHPVTGAHRPSAEVFQGGKGPLPLLALQQSRPECARQLLELAEGLERELQDAVQIDFVICEGTLLTPVHCPLERTPQAAVKIAVSLAQEGLISREMALRRVTPEQIDRLLLPSFESAEVRAATRQQRLLASGRGLGLGAATGRVARDVAGAWRAHHGGEQVILVTEELTYRERELLPVLSGAVVRRGATAALVAHHYDFPAVLVDQELPLADTLSLDAHTGQVFQGTLALVPGTLSADAAELLSWADAVRRLEVRANLGCLPEVALARALGAQGVGLFRLEALLQPTLRLADYQRALKAICQGDAPEPALARALEDDLVELFLAASAPECLPFVLRLLDAPLAPLLRYWKDYTPLPPDYFQGGWESWLDELNSLQGLRLGRLSLMFPALLQLQAEAIVQAWVRARAQGACLRLQVMMPGVCDERELRLLRDALQACAPEEMPEVGSMLELPRACLRAGQLAAEADFLSFGTGDLTETTCGLSRYDAPLSFLPAYLEQGIFAEDPYQAIDQEGVGVLMELAVERARAARPSLSLGACGRQAAHAASVAFCQRLGLDYVSVTPGRVPGARLAAAQAVLGL